jgi:hypothetical protein
VFLHPLCIRSTMPTARPRAPYDDDACRARPEAWRQRRNQRRLSGRLRWCASAIGLRNNLQRAVIVAMVAVRMVHMTVDQVVDMVSVRHGLVPTGRAMLVALWMSATIVAGRAAVGICGRHRDGMFVDMILVRVMKMAVVETRWHSRRG